MAPLRATPTQQSTGRFARNILDPLQFRHYLISGWRFPCFANLQPYRLSHVFHRSRWLDTAHNKIEILLEPIAGKVSLIFCLHLEWISEH
jgi:hypothetical protein